MMTNKKLARLLCDPAVLRLVAIRNGIKSNYDSTYTNVATNADDLEIVFAWHASSSFYQKIVMSQQSLSHLLEHGFTKFEKLMLDYELR